MTLSLYWNVISKCNPQNITLPLLSLPRARCPGQCPTHSQLSVSTCWRNEFLSHFSALCSDTFALQRSRYIQPFLGSSSWEGGSRESSAPGLYWESVAAGRAGGKAVRVLSNPAGRWPLPRHQRARGKSHRSSHHACSPWVWRDWVKDRGKGSWGMNFGKPLNTSTSHPWYEVTQWSPDTSRRS